MGFAIPKLPLLNKAPKKLKVVNPMASGGMSTAIGSGHKPMIKTCPNMIGTPLWAPRDDNYVDVAYDIRTATCHLVGIEYRSKEWEDDDYTRIYVVNPDGSPAPYNKGIWKLLHDRIATDSSLNLDYDVSEDGKFTLHGDRLKVKDAWCCVRDMIHSAFYWDKSPTAKDYDTVLKLHDAQEAIYKMKREEQHKWIETQIKECQDAIKLNQDVIQHHEKELNKIYEEAADALNLFEECGITPDMENYEEKKAECSETTVDGGLNHHLMFAGSAHITPVAGTQYANVQFDIFEGQAKINRDGDLVYDVNNGLQAIHYNGKWLLVK